MDSKILVDNKIDVPANKRNIGLVFQSYALFPHLTVEKNIAFAFKAAKKNYSVHDVHKQLEWVGLESLARKYPSELSGGQQQRVALVRALVPCPNVLLMDEPFVSLDMDLRKKVIAQTVKILRDSEMSALIVTHNISDIEIFVDRIEQWM